MWIFFAIAFILVTMILAYLLERLVTGKWPKPGDDKEDPWWTY